MQSVVTMNIFYLDRDPVKCASYHCDKHVVKMVLETAQLLSTAHRELGSDVADKCYRKTHVNHPSAIWVRSSDKHYRWAWRLFIHLNGEYLDRYNRVHLSWSKMYNVLKTTPITIPYQGWIDPPQCMPNAYKQEDTVEAYRTYYKNDKPFAAWNHSDSPDWF